MEVHIFNSPAELGAWAGKKAAALLKEAIGLRGVAHLVLATGASQFETLRYLTSDSDMEWGKVILFHLDEYLGIPLTHKASFRKYLQERVLAKVPPLQSVYLIDGQAPAAGECRRLNDLIRVHPIDVALVGMGENGHLAFNDPPADFNTKDPYIMVQLDQKCREQQVREAWFDRLEDVPLHAISMSVSQIMKSSHIICSVPEQRKASAVRDCLQNTVSPLYPASILQQHPSCDICLDADAASLLSTSTITQATK